VEEEEEEEDEDGNKVPEIWSKSKDPKWLALLQTAGLIPKPEIPAPKVKSLLLLFSLELPSFYSGLNPCFMSLVS